MPARNVTTIEPMVQDQSPAELTAPARRPRWLIVLTIVTLLVGTAFLVTQRYTSHLYALAPGSAPSVEKSITIKSPGVVHPHKGRILLVTVALRTVQPLSYLADRLDHNVQIVDERALVGPAKPSQLNQANQVAMSNSTQTAVIVALQRLGYTVKQQNLGAQVTDVVAGTPADGHLQPGDVITAIDGTPTPTNTALVAALTAHHAGDVVKLSVKRGSATRAESVKLAPSPQGQVPPRPFIGIETTTMTSDTLPFDVTIDPGNIGGPSAGLAFTLGVIDQLSAGDLTGGRTIAATGTIEPDGSVGDVGGVVQKTAAVRQAGAVAFLVPPGEYADALKHAGPKLKVMKVTSLEQALNALKGLGGDVSLPPVPAAPAAAA
jgi:PDZ domain-containing protein